MKQYIVTALSIAAFLFGVISWGNGLTTDLRKIETILWQKNHELNELQIKYDRLLAYSEKFAPKYKNEIYILELEDELHALKKQKTIQLDDDTTLTITVKDVSRLILVCAIGGLLFSYILSRIDRKIISNTLRSSIKEGKE